MATEFKEFIIVTFNAVKDNKITDYEREQILKELSDLSPYAKEIKDKFILDTKNIGIEIKDLYDNLKTKIKKE